MIPKHRIWQQNLTQSKELWKLPRAEWLVYGVTPEQFASVASLPPDLAVSVFAEVADYGPNGFNVIRAAEVVSDIVEKASAQQLKEIERQGFTYFREGPWSIPGDVQTNLEILADSVKPASHPSEGERILIVFLEIICWNGFIMGDPDREDEFIQLQEDVCKALKLNFNDFTWTDPNQRAWEN